MACRNLLDLHTELLMRIMGFVTLLPYPYPVHTLLYTCRQLYNIALPFSVRTFWYIQDLRISCESGPNTRRQRLDPTPYVRRQNLLFFRYITITKPWLAVHVRAIKENHWPHHNEGPPLWHNPQRRLFSDEQDVAERLIQAANVEEADENWPANGRPCRDGEHWRKELSRGTGDAAMALLILACPRIEELSIASSGSSNIVLRLLFEASRRDQNGTFLQHLRSYREDCQELAYGNRNWHWEASNVFRLPRIQSFESRAGNAERCLPSSTFDGEFPIPPQSSSIQHISVGPSRLTLEFVKSMLRACRIVRSFTYSRREVFQFTSGVVPPPEAMPHEILDALMPHTETLENLHLHFDDERHVNTGWLLAYARDKTYLSAAIAKFKKLKTLQMGMQFLTGLPDSDYYTRHLGLQPDQYKIEGAPTLAELLPESLESLKVLCCGQDIISQAQELLHVVSTGQRFKSLTRIELCYKMERDYPDGNPFERLRCDKPGVRLLVEPHVEDYRTFDYF